MSLHTVDSARVQEHFDLEAQRLNYWRQLNRYYYDELVRILRKALGPVSSATVLDVGCGRGDILADLGPKSGVGLDFSSSTIEQAKSRYRDRPLEFHAVEFAGYEPPEPFDCVVAANVLEHLPPEGVAAFVEKLLRCARHSVVILGTEPSAGWLLEVAERLGLKMPEGPHDWRHILRAEELLRSRQPPWQVRTTKWLPIPRRLPMLWRLNRSAQPWGFIRLVEARRVGALSSASPPPSEGIRPR